jgi:Protein of unknown function (DUF3108)
MSQRYFKWFILSGLCMVLGASYAQDISHSNNGLSSASQETYPQHVALNYDLHWKGLNGKASYTVDQKDRNHYAIRSVAQGRGLASILGKAVMVSEGEMDAARHLRPYFFRLDKPLGQSEQAQFDWGQGTIRLKDGQVVSFKSNASVYDPLSLVFQFYWNPPTHQLKNVTVATTKKVALYIFKKEGDETLQIAGVSVHTEVWKRYSPDGTLEMTVWLAPKHHYLPVKMHDYDGPNEVRELILSNLSSI